MPDSALPRKYQIFHPKTGELIGSYPHWDYPKWLSWIPRGWTAFAWGLPVQIAGSQLEQRVDRVTGDIGPAPIGENGSWQLSRFPGAPGWLSRLPLYFAFTTSGGWHMRVGARWDDVDGYVQFPTFARRHYEGGDAQDTGTGPTKKP